MKRRCRDLICLLLTIVLLITVIVLIYFIIKGFLANDIGLYFLNIIILVGIIVFIAYVIQKLCTNTHLTDMSDTVPSTPGTTPTYPNTSGDSTTSNNSNTPKEASSSLLFSNFQNPKGKRPQSQNNIDPTAPSKEFVKKKLPVIILIIVLIVFLFQQGYIPLGSSDPVGRWVFERPENTTVDGVMNLTDYWYMDFYEDGTMTIGWKNVGSPEDPEGHGTWYQEGRVIYLTIYYDYGDTNYSTLKIQFNQLVDANTGEGTGYYRD